jgi:hypothetical protein
MDSESGDSGEVVQDGIDLSRSGEFGWRRLDDLRPGAKGGDYCRYENPASYPNQLHTSETPFPPPRETHLLF